MKINHKLVNYLGWMFFIMLFASNVLFASVSIYEYKKLLNNIQAPVKTLAKRFPNGMSYSLYTSENYLKPFGIKEKNVIIKFYRVHNDLPYAIKNRIADMLSQIEKFEEARSEYSKKVVVFAKGTKDIANSIGDGDVGGFLLNLLSSKVDEGSVDIYENKLRKEFYKLIDIIENLDKEISNRIN